MVDTDTINDLKERMKKLESEYAIMKRMIIDNTDITKRGFETSNKEIAKVAEVVAVYNAMRVGGMTLSKVGQVIITISAAWLVVKDYLTHIK